MPRLHFVEPMKALMTASPPHDGQWLYEVKFDGFRTLAVKNGREIDLWSRNKKRFDERFPAIAKAVAGLGVKQCILDGEVCALDERGRSSFQLLQNQAESDHPVVYYIFDLLAKGTKNLRGLPLSERRKELESTLADCKPPIHLSSAFTENPTKILKTMRTAGAEGVIAKRIDSVYETGRRSGAWIKIKFHREQEFVVVGYTRPKKSRQHFGALLLGYYRGKDLIFAGHVGTGFSHKALRDIFQLLKPLECAKPLVKEIREPSTHWRPRGWKPSETRWIRPKLVVQVRFTEWTSDGILRHPSFLGLRDDKVPADVVRE